MSRRKSLLLRVLAVGNAAVLAYFGLVRPWFLNWGATAAELEREWPGDSFVPHPPYSATRAVTIHASAGEIWPWLTQIGQDRAGFYSYTWLENLFRADMHNADRIIPEFQDRKVGDTMWLARKDRYGGQARQIIVALEPNRAMVTVGPPDAQRIAEGGYAGGSWTFILEPVTERTTRLIMRSRGQAVVGRLFQVFVFDPAHFIMEQKMMREIKRLAEKHVQQRASR